MHISSVIVLARTSSVPRKMPGNPMELLTWLGKSLRPVATTAAPAALASHGHISGIGLEHTKTMGSGRHGPDPVRMDGVRALLAERDADVGALQGVGDAALALLLVGDLAVLPLVDPLVLDGLDVRAALVEDALAVDEAALLAVGAVGEDEAADGHVGRAARR